MACTHCGKPGDEEKGVKLKKCTGVSCTLYLLLSTELLMLGNTISARSRFIARRRYVLGVLLSLICTSDPCDG